MRVRHIVICGLSSSTIFSTFSHKQYDLERKVIIKCVFISTALSETFLIPRRIEQDIIKMYIGINVKYQLFSSDIKET
jgi:hypothetical protein